MALRVKPYFFPERWIVMGERSTLTVGKKSRLGEESRDEGLDEKEWGDMGLANGEKPPCCSTGRGRVSNSWLILCLLPSSGRAFYSSAYHDMLPALVDKQRDVICRKEMIVRIMK